MSEEAFPRIEKISRPETHLRIPEPGGTYICVIRNGDDFRGRPAQLDELKARGEDIQIGALMPSAQEKAREFGERELTQALDGLTPAERTELDVIVVASNAKLGPLATADGHTPLPYQRCVETGQYLLEGVEQAFLKLGLPPEHLLNRRIQVAAADESAKPLVLRDIEDMKIAPRTEEYFAFLQTKVAELATQGHKTNIWVLYEEDRYKSVREELGVEGPKEIAARMQNFFARAEKLARMQHARSPDRRLLVLAVAPRDVVGPWLNINITGLSPEGHEIPRIEPLAGFGVGIDASGNASFELGVQKKSI